MFVLSWLLSSSPNQLPGGHNLVSGPGDPGSGEPPPKCTSKFFTFFYHSPRHNLAWCKVFITKSIFWNYLLSWFWPAWTRCQKLVHPHGWKTSYCWPTRPRRLSPAWWVKWHKSYLPSANMTGPGHEAQKDAYLLSKAEPRPVERHSRLQPNLYGGSVSTCVRAFAFHLMNWSQI